MHNSGRRCSIAVPGIQHQAKAFHIFRLNFYDSSLKMHRGPVSLHNNLECINEEDGEQAKELDIQGKLGLASIPDSSEVRKIKLAKSVLSSW